VLFEGSDRAVEAQLAAAQALAGGVEGDAAIWEESRVRQAAARGRVRFAPRELADVLSRLPEAVVRAAAGVAYVPHEVADDSDPGVARLLDALRSELDPRGILAA
jgi:hypothetical protein